MKVPPKRKGNWGLDVFAALFSHASMKVPPKRKGNAHRRPTGGSARSRLNESPSEKEGKCQALSSSSRRFRFASMKVPPKRKGNYLEPISSGILEGASMKVPPKRKGNMTSEMRAQNSPSLNESPSEKEGK